MQHIRYRLLLGFCAVLAFSFTLTGCKDEAESGESAAVEAVVKTVAEVPEPVVNIDVEAALRERVMGDANAPITISEHSSLTCGHCGKFHQTTFKEIKEKYVDTGKVKIVFADFPLNGPALHATLSARCILDDAKYFDYIQELFETQDKWAYDVGYLSHLKATASKYGLNEATFSACLGSEELQTGLLKKVRENQTKHNLTSTPSFVINGKDKLKGGLPLTAFEEIFNKTE